MKWYPGVTSRSANGLPRRLSPPPLPPEMSVSRLLRTRVCAAAADADATAADAEAARLEDPGHGCSASGTEPSFKLGKLQLFLGCSPAGLPCHHAC